MPNGNAEEDCFKVYMRDCGLFVSMLEDGTQYDILQGNLFGYKGAIFENLIADIFAKMGRKLYYCHKDSGLEVFCNSVSIRLISSATLCDVSNADAFPFQLKLVQMNWENSITVVDVHTVS